MNGGTQGKESKVVEMEEIMEGMEQQIEVI